MKYNIYSIRNSESRSMRWLLYVYVFLMPFTNFHPLGLNTTLGAIASSPSFLVSVVGILMLIYQSYGRVTFDSNGLYRRLFQVVIGLNCISLLMAVVLYKRLGVLGNETTFDAILGDVVYWFQVLFIVIFNIMLFKKIRLSSFEKVIKVVIITAICIGYIEILMIMMGGPFTSICELLYRIGIIYNPASMLRTGKVFLMYSEASYAEIILCALVWPYLCSKIIAAEEDIKKSVFLFVLTIPIVLYNQSSSVMLGLGVIVVLTTVLFFKNSNMSRKKIIGFVSTILIIFVLLFIIRDQFFPLFVEKVLEKPFDENDYSTIQRSSVIRNCIMTFIKYPLLGVGNGNQGYFYEGHLTRNDYRSYEILETLKYNNGVPSAGSWFGGFLSGYGIVGCILMIFYVVSSNRIMKKYSNTKWYYMYYLTAGCFLVCSWFTASLVGGYLQLLFLSLPFVLEDKIEKEESE